MGRLNEEGTMRKIVAVLLVVSIVARQWILRPPIN
jgi:hypothetical protein